MRESPALPLQECMDRHFLINVSPDSDPRQVVRRRHGGQYQGGSERFWPKRFLQRFLKKSVKTGSLNRPILFLNLTFRGFCENRVFKVSIDRSVCHGFIYSRQKSIIFRTNERTNGRTNGNISLAAPTNVRSASRNYLYLCVRSTGVQLSSAFRIKYV